MKTQAAIATLIFLITAAVSTGIVSSPTATAFESIVTVDISSAYYADLDGDSLEDDIFSQVDVVLAMTYNKGIDYTITLTLPSGAQYSYSFKLYVSSKIFSINNYMYNLATESGWYQIDATITLRNGVGGSDQIVFDPPGGSCCDDPEVVITVT